MQSFAKLVTKIFNPLITGLATVFVVVFIQQIPIEQKIIWLLLGATVAIIPPIFFYYLYKKGKISSLWSPNVHERQKPFVSWVAVSAAYSGLAYWCEAPRLIVALGLVFLILGLLNLVLSSSVKISIHAELATLFVVTTILSVSVSYIYLTILIILVAWARVYLKAHDITEISLGILATIISTYFVFNLFGLATF